METQYALADCDPVPSLIFIDIQHACQVVLILAFHGNVYVYIYVAHRLNAYIYKMKLLFHILVGIHVFTTNYLKNKLGKNVHKHTLMFFFKLGILFIVTYKSSFKHPCAN